jgi:hypothetical protein
MIAKAPRYVPILTGLFWVGISIAILFIWPAPDGLLYWVRGVIFTLPAFFGLHSLKIGLFASDKRIRNLTAGNPDD